MTPQQVVGLGVRLFAIWLALIGLPYVVYIPFTLARQHLDFGTTTSYLIGAGFFIVAILLWIFPMVVAHLLIPRTTFDNVLTVSTSEAAKVGCCLLGLWLLIKSGPALVSFLFRGFLVAGEGALFSSLNVDQKLDLAILVVETAIAIFLVTRADTVATLLMRHNPPNAGRDESL
jgi:hypothetical protein